MISSRANALKDGQRAECVEMRLNSVENSLGIRFQDREILFRALTHSSALNENKKFLYDNQRLEFLGDSVLSLVITDHLFSTNQDFSEGDMKVAIPLVPK